MSRLYLSLAACAALACGAAFAQNRPPPPGTTPQPAVPATNPAELSGNRGIDNRLDRDEKALRELREIVLKAVATKAPVEVKEEGPDPQITDLQAKFDDMQQTLQRVNGQMDLLGHNLDLATKALNDATQANKALAARIDKLEAAAAAAQAAAPPAVAAGPGGPPPPTGVLGQLPAAGPPPPGAPDTGAAPGQADEILAYRQARSVLDSGDYAGGAAALQDYLARYPASPRAAEANYWLGRTLALRNMPADAAAAYARSLKGWPDTAWAGDAVVRLSTSLADMKRPDDACKALVEFDNRYAAKAPAAIKTRAKDSRARAACG